MMWNDIVKANCARANTTASQPSNIGTTCRSFAGRDIVQKRNWSFRKLRPNQALTLPRPVRRLYLCAARNRRAGLSLVQRWCQSQSSDNLGLHRTGLVLADQHRAADLSPGAEADRD